MTAGLDSLNFRTCQDSSTANVASGSVASPSITHTHTQNPSHSRPHAHTAGYVSSNPSTAAFITAEKQPCPEGVHCKVFLSKMDPQHNRDYCHTATITPAFSPASPRDASKQPAASAGKHCECCLQGGTRPFPICPNGAEDCSVTDLHHLSTYRHACRDSRTGRAQSVQCPQIGDATHRHKTFHKCPYLLGSCKLESTPDHKDYYYHVKESGWFGQSSVEATKQKALQAHVQAMSSGGRSSNASAVDVPAVGRGTSIPPNQPQKTSGRKRVTAPANSPPCKYGIQCRMWMDPTHSKHDSHCSIFAHPAY